MALGRLFEKTIKLVGVVSKVSVELGADVVGTVAEKINDNPELKKRISEYGVKKGQSIKSVTSEIAYKSSNIVDKAVEAGINVVKDSGIRIKDELSQLKETIDPDIKDMKPVEQKIPTNLHNSSPLETYSTNEIAKVGNCDFLIISKFISLSNKVVFDILIKSEKINIGSDILVNNPSGTFKTKIISIDSAVNKYDILNDGTINIINKGVPGCRELYKTGIRNEILSIVVQGKPANYRFIGQNEISKGNLIEKEESEIYSIETHEKDNKPNNKYSYVKSKDIIEEKNKTSNEPNLNQTIGNLIGFSDKSQLVDNLMVGEKLYLLRDYSNKWDKNAIKVNHNIHNIVGYISKDIQDIIAPLMDKGERFSCEVLEIVRGNTNVIKLLIKRQTTISNKDEVKASILASNNSNKLANSKTTKYGDIKFIDKQEDNISDKSMYEIVMNSVSLTADQSTTFLNFVNLIEESTLKYFLEGYYEKLKVSHSFNPVHLGENGCFEFAGTMLLFLYSNVKKHSIAVNACNQALIMAFKGASPGIFSNVMDDIINEETNTSYEDWSAVYRYLKSNYGIWIRKIEFASDYTMNDHLRYKEFIESI